MSEKISMPVSNDFCPQTLFCYGTYCDDGRPDFGLFCWFSYLWDGELGVMMCIGEDKQTRDNIRKNRCFSANLVTEKLLPLADYLVLCDSPVVFELEAVRSIMMDEGEVFFCKIRNLLMDKALTDQSVSLEKRIGSIAPVSTTCETYFSWDGRALGGWGEIMKK